MSRRYWLPILAVVGLTLTANVNAQPVNNDGTAATTSQQSKPQVAKPAEPKPPVAIAPKPVEPIAKPLETTDAKAKAAKEEKNAQDNLDVQRDMAASARGMIIIGGLEAFITFVGVGLVALTLSAARRQAVAAERTLDQTRRAANATVGAERDRLIVTGIFLQNLANASKPNKVLQWDYIYVNFRNGGRSAANVVAISLNRLVTEVLPDKPVYGKPRAINAADQHAAAGEQWQHLSPGYDRTDDPIEEKLADEILAANRLDYWVYGYIDYFNFVGDRETLKFCGWLNANRLAIEGNTHLVLGGPDAYTKN